MANYNIKSHARLGEGLSIQDNVYIGDKLTTATLPLEINSTTAMRIPAGLSSERPVTTSVGQIRYNTEEDLIEFYNVTTGLWQLLGTSSSQFVDLTTDQTIDGNKTITGFTSIGGNQTLGTSTGSYIATSEFDFDTSTSTNDRIRTFSRRYFDGVEYNSAKRGFENIADNTRGARIEFDQNELSFFTKEFTTTPDYTSLPLLLLNDTSAEVDGDVVVSGDIVVAGNVHSASDERIKSDIVIIDSALEKVKQIHGYTYLKNEVREMGVLAQEVQKIAPEVVHEDENGMLSVAYGNMVGLLIEAVKELSDKIDNLNK